MSCGQTTLELHTLFSKHNYHCINYHIICMFCLTTCAFLPHIPIGSKALKGKHSVDSTTLKQSVESVSSSVTSLAGGYSGEQEGTYRKQAISILIINYYLQVSIVVAFIVIENH